MHEQISHLVHFLFTVHHLYSQPHFRYFFSHFATLSFCSCWIPSVVKNFIDNSLNRCHWYGIWVNCFSSLYSLHHCSYFFHLCISQFILSTTFNRVSLSPPPLFCVWGGGAGLASESTPSIHTLIFNYQITCDSIFALFEHLTNAFLSKNYLLNVVTEVCVIVAYYTISFRQ